MIKVNIVPLCLTGCTSRQTQRRCGAETKSRDQLIVGGYNNLKALPFRPKIWKAKSGSKWVADVNLREVENI